MFKILNLLLEDLKYIKSCFYTWDFKRKILSHELNPETQGFKKHTRLNLIKIMKIVFFDFLQL